MALPAHMTMKGEKQGDIPGDCIMKGREKTIIVQALEHHVQIPVDNQTGLATGKRHHGAFKIVKDWDQASPLINAALCSGEHLINVTIKFYRIAKTGVEEHYYTTTMEDATVVSVRPWMANCNEPSATKTPLQEEVSFTYRKISWRHETAKKESHDDWANPLE